MEHEQARELIHPYIDGELDAANAQSMMAHVQKCAECSASEQRLAALRTALTNTEPSYRAPGRLRRKVRTAIRREARTTSEAPAGWLRFAFPAAVMALLLLGLALWQSSRTAEARIVDEVIASHVRSLLATHLVDVASSDQHTVKPWFNGKIDFAPDVRDLAADGFPLVGGRLDYLTGKTVVALVYRRNQHPINLLITPSGEKSNSGPSTLSRRGYHLVHWTHNELSYWAVSDLNGDELRQFVELLTK